MGQYYKAAIVKDDKKTIVSWMYTHDYGNGLKLMEHSYMKNTYVNTFENQLIGKPQRVVWGGDYAANCTGRATSIYDRCKDSKKINPEVIEIPNKYKFLVNHSKKLFVDKTKASPIPDWGEKIHPLPLLTCEGNGQGGGDFRGSNDLVGTWSRDKISVETKEPTGYKELIFDPVE